MNTWNWVFEQGGAEPANYRLVVNLEENAIELTGSSDARPWGGSRSVYTIPQFVEMMVNGQFEGVNHPMYAFIVNKKRLKELIELMQDDRLTAYYESKT